MAGTVAARAARLGDLTSAAAWPVQVARGFGEVALVGASNAQTLPISISFTPNRRVLWGINANITLRGPAPGVGAQALVVLNQPDANGFNNSGMQGTVYTQRRTFNFDAQFKLNANTAYRATILASNFDASGGTTVWVDGSAWLTWVFGRVIGTW